MASHQPAAVPARGSEHSESQVAVPTADDPEYMADRLQWLIRLRWGAVAGVLLAVVAGIWSGVLTAPAPMAILVLMLAAYNLALNVWGQTGQPSPGPWQRLILVQLLMDSATLAALLHFSDGVENPFSSAFVFPVAVGAMLLPRAKAIVLGVGVCVMQGGTVVAEAVGLLLHHPMRTTLGHGPMGVDPVLSSPLLFGYLAAFTLTILGVTYFVNAMTVRHARSEQQRREQERLAQTRLRLARVGAVSAGVAHAIRNPLHGLLGCVEILQRRMPDQERETVELMGEGLQHIERITRRLLSLARDAPLNCRSVGLDGLVDETVRRVCAQAAAGDGQVVTELADSGVVWVDPDRISEALANVLDNALQACSDGGDVKVTTHKAGERAEIVVKDTGCGMPPEDLARVFEPFFTTKQVGVGTGLGLKIARRILEDHGGEVWMESQPGAGTSVHLIVPRRPAAGST